MSACVHVGGCVYGCVYVGGWVCGTSVGCGNSEFGVRLAAASETWRVINSDFEAGVVSQMAARFPLCQWQVLDVTNLAVEDATQDLVIDKATLDALLASKIDCVRQSGAQAMSEFARVLRRGSGRILLLSNKAPEVMVPLGQSVGLSPVENDFEILRELEASAAAPFIYVFSRI